MKSFWLIIYKWHSVSIQIADRGIKFAGRSLLSFCFLHQIPTLPHYFRSNMRGIFLTHIVSYFDDDYYYAIVILHSSLYKSTIMLKNTNAKHGYLTYWTPTLCLIFELKKPLQTKCIKRMKPNGVPVAYVANWNFLPLTSLPWRRGLQCSSPNLIPPRKLETR